MGLITPDILYIFNALKPHKAKLVGGAVRDYLMNGAISNDIDIATTATPDEVTILLTKAGLHVIPTGLKHGTVTAIYNKKPYEITTLRKDISTDGRHATVLFTTSFEEDASRRDFTFNALYMDENGEIEDYFEGVNDLKNEQIRFIGHANKRIEEDYLRILRYFRFHGKFSKEPKFDNETLTLIKEKSNKLTSLSAERITSEIFKILSNGHAEVIWSAMANSHVLKNIDLEKIQLNNYRIFIKEYPNEINGLTSLACLYEHEGSDYLTRNAYLSFSNKEKSYLKKLIKAIHSASCSNWQQEAYRWTKDIYLTALMIQNSKEEDNNTHTTTINQVENFNVPRFPVSGHDLIQKDHTEGVEIGNTLKRLEKWWLENNFPDKNTCLNQLKK